MCCPKLMKVLKTFTSFTMFVSEDEATVHDLVLHIVTEDCEELRLVSPNYYRFGCIVDLVVLLIYYSDCVDRSGSLSSGAFNQLRLATLNIVLTILYLLKTVLQRSLLQCLNSLYKSDEVF